MFNAQDTSRFLVEADFPKFELSYETMTHNKVLDANVMLAIPEGNKFYAWFTTYKADNVCFLLEISPVNKLVCSSKIIVTGFNDSLAYGNGTVLYGTVFQTLNSNKVKGNTCFSIEDIYHYRGKSYQNESYLTKLKSIKNMLLNEMSQIALLPNYVIFGLPLLNTNFNTMLREIEYLPYKIVNILFRYFNTKKALYIKYYKPNVIFTDLKNEISDKNNIGNTSNTSNTSNASNTSNRTNTSNRNIKNAIFIVKPEIQNDIYNLYIYKNGTEEYYDIACIQEYTTSVMMNRLFRNIKENQNLDALEESDDETEFQNEKEDKFVFLDKSFKMHCTYNVKFKKWTPVSVAARNERVTTDIVLCR
jgi:hypothetical protein